MHRFLLIAIISTFIFNGDLYAQRGRFLKRLRDDILGTQQSQQQSQQRTQQRTTAQPRTPSPANVRQPTLAGQQRRPQSPANSRLPNSNALNRRPTGPLHAQSRKKTGFGMTVKLNDSDQLIAATVDPYGNAAQVGVRPGDQILEFGGMDATTVEEFDEIAKIMSAGDQLEMRYKQRGQSKKVMVQYGEDPEADDEQARDLDPAPDRNVRVPKSNYDFAPPRQQESNPGQLRSVLDGDAPAKRQATGAGYVNRRQVDLLNRTVQSQQQTIRQLQNEVMQLRRVLQGRR